MLGSGNNLSRGSGAPSNMPPLPQCLPLEPIMLGDPKYPRPGELRRVLGVHGTTEDHSFGAAHLKAPAPVGKVELKHFKESVQDASKKARDRAKMLHESMLKVDKYREALSSKKRQRSEHPLVKPVSHSHRRPHDIMNQRLEDRANNIVLNKRIRTSVADHRADSRSASDSRQQMFADKDGNTLQPVSGSSGRNEEKSRRLLAAGECLDQKIKKKRSVGAVGSRVLSGDRDVKQLINPKPSADSKLRSCDSHSFRLKSYGVVGVNKLDSSCEPTNSDSSAIHKSERDSPTLPRDRVAVLESGLLVRGSNKPDIQQHNSVGSPSSVTKGKVAKAQRTSSVMALDSSPGVRPSGAFQGCEQPTAVNKVAVANNKKREVSAAAGSPMHHMAQWVGQRPHKNSRSRRTNLVSPVSNHVETQISSQGFATSEFSTRTSSVGTTGSVLLNNVDNDSPKFKSENENFASLYDFSESEESGAGENKLKEREIKINSGEASLATSHKVGAFVLPIKKNKITTNESGDGFKKQGRSGRGPLARPGIPLVKENLKKKPTTEPLQDLVPVSDKNRSKTGRPPKKLKDLKGVPRLRPALSNGSSDFTGESDDDHEELFLAANSARSAGSLACSNTFWKKMDYVFASVGAEDAAYLNQQLSVAEELGESLSQILGDGLKVLGLVDEGSGIHSGERRDVLYGRFDRRLDKVTPLYQRVLSALIEDDESEDFYHHIEGKNTSLQYTSDDSHSGSCNQIDTEPKDKDRVESEVESNLGFHTHKNCLLDRLSCDSSAATNTSRSTIMSSFVHSNEWWRGDDEFSHSDVSHVGEICSNDHGRLQLQELDVPSFSPSDSQYQLMSINDKLLLELQSIGLNPETLPDLAEGEEVINGDLMELKERLYKQIVKKKKTLEKIDRAIQKGRDVERRKIEQVALDKLIEMAYRKRMACRGSSASKSGIRKVPRQVALAFVKRTLARCLKFEDTGKSCFTDLALQDILFSSSLCNNETKSVDCIGSGTASNTCNEAFYQAEVGGRGAVSCASERYDSHSNHYSERASYKQGSTLNRGKKREVLIDDVVGSASSRVTPAFDTSVLEAKGKRSDRDNSKNNSFCGSGRSSLDSSQTERKTKVKSKQKNTRSTSGSGFQGRFMEATDTVSNRKGESTLPVNALKETEEPTDFGNLQFKELDPVEELGASHDLGGNQDLTSWLNFEEDGLIDHDSVGLEIPMDDLSDLNMLM